MLDKIDLNQSLGNKQYKNEMEQLEEKLSSLQQKIKDLSLPVIIAFEGWSAAGKGTLISRILYPLDPRNFNVFTMAKVNEEAIMRPFLWSYWTKTPSRGRMTIFDKSWHRGVLPESVAKWNFSETERQGLYYDINAFEKQLYDDGNLIIKFFLHISKEEQKKRFKELEKSPDTKWRVDNHDWQQNKEYDSYITLYEDMIHNTNSGECQWSIIEANDKNYATVKIYKIIIKRIEEAIQKKITIAAPFTVTDTFTPPEISILSSVDVKKDITEKEYKNKMEQYQKRIQYLGYKLYAKRKSVVIVYEGWDAAGKGGNIKRLTEELDPRGYEVVPISAPTTEELSHHYLWRFYNKMPKDGHMAIFDRSWYGRVMVERIEKLCKTEEWQRAYREINDMELHMSNHGVIIFKLWLHIDKDEQLERFQARQQDPSKQYKITDEDWRNRDKWDEYEKAVNEMLFKTNTPHAPWTIVESNNKKFARIKVLELVVSELEKRLE